MFRALYFFPANVLQYILLHYTLSFVLSFYLSFVLPCVVYQMRPPCIIHLFGLFMILCHGSFYKRSCYQYFLNSCWMFFQFLVFSCFMLFVQFLIYLLCLVSFFSFYSKTAYIYIHNIYKYIHIYIYLDPTHPFWHSFPQLLVPKVMDSA